MNSLNVQLSRPRFVDLDLSTSSVLKKDCHTLYDPVSVQIAVFAKRNLTSDSYSTYPQQFLNRSPDKEISAGRHGRIKERYTVLYQEERELLQQVQIMQERYAKVQPCQYSAAQALDLSPQGGPRLQAFILSHLDRPDFVLMVKRVT